MGLGPKTMNVDVNDLKDRVCIGCGSNLFADALRLKEIPAVYSPSGKPESLVVKVGFVCVGCGRIKSLRPGEEKEEGEEKKPEEPAQEKSNIIMLGG